MIESNTYLSVLTVEMATQIETRHVFVNATVTGIVNGWLIIDTSRRSETPSRVTIGHVEAFRIEEVKEVHTSTELDSDSKSDAKAAVEEVGLLQPLEPMPWKYRWDDDE